MAVQAQYPANVILSDFKARAAQTGDYKNMLGIDIGYEGYQTASLPMGQVHPSPFTLVPNNPQTQNTIIRNNMGFQAFEAQTGSAKASRKSTDTLSTFSPQGKRQCLMSCSDHHKPGTVSTGLRLTFEEERATSLPVKSAIHSSNDILSSISEELETKLHQERDELDQFLRIQGEQLKQSLMERKQKYLRSFVMTAEENLVRGLKEKVVQIEKASQRNLELEVRLKQLKLEAHIWQEKAKSNEDVIVALKNNLQHAMIQCREQSKEGFGDTEVDDAESGYVDPNSDTYINNKLHQVNKHAVGQKICKVCCKKSVSILLLPCRHLCLCRDCGMSVDVCPLCHTQRNASLEVYMS